MQPDTLPCATKIGNGKLAKFCRLRVFKMHVILLVLMITALQNARSGLQAASQKLDGAASDIVRGGMRSSGEAQAGDLVNGLVALNEAKFQFTASAKLIGVIAHTEQRVLDILA